MRDNELIRCEGVWKVYNEGRPYEVRALEDVSLRIERGSFAVFNGPSGSGKTTLMGIIGTIHRPSRGKVYLNGKDISGFSDTALSRIRRERIGFVFQNFNLIPKLPAWENVSVPLIPLCITEGDRRQKALQLLNMFGLAERAHHCPEELSGGEQQRVAIVRALINDPEIIMLDEPTSNIDAENISLLTGILEDLRAKGKTILVSSHDESLLKRADQIFELRRGHLTGIRTP
ncbi:MAG: ABC transporter ATP-binding protein [Thermodesulfovibrionales bacterium]